MHEKPTETVSSTTAHFVMRSVSVIMINNACNISKSFSKVIMWAPKQLNAGDFF